MDHTFTAYGHRLSGLRCLDVATTGPAPFDAIEVIHRPEPSAAGPHFTYADDGSSAHLGWRDYAEYRYSAGPPRTIEITLDEASAHAAELCLAISALPLLLPVLDLEVIHGSAVATPSGALVLVGRSGAGKSSLTAELVARGLPYVADDACAVDDDGRLWPGPPLLGLRNRTLAAALDGRSHGEYVDKVVIEPQCRQSDPLPVAGIVLLDREEPVDSVQVRRLPPGQALPELLAHVRSPSVLPARRRPAQLAMLARHVSGPVAAVRFTPDVHPVAEVADAILGWLARA